jgi:hypothetical protein
MLMTFPETTSGLTDRGKLGHVQGGDQRADM